MEEAVMAWLLAASTSAGNRVYWGLIEQGKPYPALRLTKVNDPATYALDGEDDTGLARVQVDAFAETFTTATQLIRQVEAAIPGAPGDVIREVFVIDRRQGPATAAPKVVFHQILDLRVVYRKGI